ncbi:MULTISPECIES: helix-turn-helix domain-containing protein [unclassified Streptomyces]|uniref:helix-turn-helix domain-containing protein n=1 Tax=unclassified Streptomyces TaxID=2593676 RepID=UPI0022B60E03|nr:MULTISPECIES: helix-turn-helix transcriptional regulator [unclassified Streptomyces]MCZ7417540.1 helix-turn-helix transcriptional regulator [Streptomyces sp. WMMC897]MCZ7432631.1 helix-turn-helix transcriptional regulator [Streptomyces sp. WMMC1477]
MAGGQGEAAEFAALLRELKERSGHSYGYLAKRCHLGTSTLHRYCHAVAVPGDYAPVERLARLCGATTDELAGLHRRWLAAEAAKTAATAASATPRDQPPAGESAAEARAPEGPAQEQRTRQQSTRTEPAPEVPRPDDTAPTPGPAPPAGTGPGSAPLAKPAPSDAGTVPSDDPVPEESSRPGDGVPAGAPGGVPGDVAVAGQPATASVTRAARVRGALRRRRVPVAVAVALAVLVAAVLVAVGRGAGPGEAEQAAPGAAAEPGSEPRRKGAGGPSGAAAPDGRGASTEPSDGGAAGSGAPEPSPSGTGDRGGRQDGGTAQGPGSPAPLTVTTRSHVWQAHCDHRYLVDPGATAPEDVPAPPVEQDAPAWATELDAVHAGRTNVEVTVQGVGDTAVVLQDLHVRVVERRTPLPWTSYAMEHGCGGALTPARFTVNLDAGRPVAVPEDGYLTDTDGTGHVLTAERMPFRVSAGEPQVLRIEASAVRCDCDWYLELAWSAGGRSGTLRIDDNGRPFRTSGAEGRPELFYWPENGWGPLEG